MRNREIEQLMNGTPLDTTSKAAENFAIQMQNALVLMTCTRCGRQMAVDVGLCLVCIGKEEEC